MHRVAGASRRRDEQRRGSAAEVQRSEYTADLSTEAPNKIDTVAVTGYTSEEVELLTALSHSSPASISPSAFANNERRFFTIVKPPEPTATKSAETGVESPPKGQPRPQPQPQPATGEKPQPGTGQRGQPDSERPQGGTDQKPQPAAGEGSQPQPAGGQRPKPAESQQSKLPPQQALRPGPIPAPIPAHPAASPSASPSVSSAVTTPQELLPSPPPVPPVPAPTSQSRAVDQPPPQSSAPTNGGAGQQTGFNPTQTMETSIASLAEPSKSAERQPDAMPTPVSPSRTLSRGAEAGIVIGSIGMANHAYINNRIC